LQKKQTSWTFSIEDGFFQARLEKFAAAVFLGPNFRLKVILDFSVIVAV
jgi:hypothetical protein